MNDNDPRVAQRRPHVDQPRVAVFTITYNQRAEVIDLMRDLAAQTYPQHLFEFVVLDDGGSDRTFEMVQAESESVPYAVTPLRRRHEADYMSATRWNECIAATDPSTALLIQVDDVRVRPDFVQQHVKWYAEGKPCLVTGAKYEGDHVAWDLASCRRAHHAAVDGGARVITAWSAAWGASLSYPRTLVDAVIEKPYDLPYDERMIGWGYHEVELAYRMVRAGAALVYDPAAGVFHKNHTDQTESRRGIDRAGALADGTHRNVRYLCDKHGLDSIPRW